MRPDFGYIEESHLHPTYDCKLMVRLAKYLKPYWLQLTLSVLLVFIINGVELALPYLTKVAIDDYILVTARKIRLPAAETLSQDIRNEYRQFLIPAKGADIFFLKENVMERCMSSCNFDTSNKHYCVARTPI